MNLNFSFIDGSGELVNLKMSSKKNDIPSSNLGSLLFEFACLDAKIVNCWRIEFKYIKVFRTMKTKWKLQTAPFWKGQHRARLDKQMSSTLTRRRLNQPSGNSNLNLQSNELSSSHKNNKKWCRALSLKAAKKEREDIRQVSVKVRDQVALDVRRAFSFKNISFTGKNCCQVSHTDNISRWRNWGQERWIISNNYVCPV